MSDAKVPTIGGAFTRAAVAAKEFGCAVNQRGSGAKRLIGGGLVAL
jgi:hypothetical protein